MPGGPNGAISAVQWIMSELGSCELWQMPCVLIVLPTNIVYSSTESAHWQYMWSFLCKFLSQLNITYLMMLAML